MSEKLILPLFEVLNSAEIKPEILRSAGYDELLQLKKKLLDIAQSNASIDVFDAMHAGQVLVEFPQVIAYLLENASFVKLLKEEYDLAPISFPEGSLLDELKVLFDQHLMQQVRPVVESNLLSYNWLGFNSWLKLMPVFPFAYSTELKQKFNEVVRRFLLNLERVTWTAEDFRTYAFIHDVQFYYALQTLDSFELNSLIQDYLLRTELNNSLPLNAEARLIVLSKLHLYKPDDLEFALKLEKQGKGKFDTDIKELDNPPTRHSSGNFAVGIGVFLTVIIFTFRIVGLENSTRKLSRTQKERERSESDQKIRELSEAFAKETSFFLEQSSLAFPEHFSFCENREEQSESPVLSLSKLYTSKETINGQLLDGEPLLIDNSFDYKPVCFANFTNQDVVVHAKLSLNSFVKIQGKLPSKKHSSVVIKPGDSLHFQEPLTQFFIASGKHLFWNASEYRNPMGIRWAFCEVSSADSSLIRQSFTCKPDLRQFGGRLEIRRVKDSYQLKWYGTENQIYNRKNGYFITTQEPYTIRGN
ncbi:MAG: hypothetical protein EP332_08890 [Bacteroidetes bacterium]|nr:MAG: hypothetical protein EP332_08890 [Bacteroidota bacterium]